MNKIEDVLAERKKTHGEYAEHARATQQVMAVWQSFPRYAGLPDVVKETLHMLAHKMGRVVTGNWAVHDHWIDTQGYSGLIVQRSVDGVGLRAEYLALSAGVYPEREAIYAPAAETRVDADAVVSDKLRAVYDELDLRSGAEGARADWTGEGEPRGVRHADGTIGGEPVHGAGLGPEPLTEKRLAVAVAHGVNYAGVEHLYGTPDYEIGSAVAPLALQLCVYWKDGIVPPNRLEAALREVMPKVLGRFPDRAERIKALETKMPEILRETVKHLRGETDVQIFEGLSQTERLSIDPETGRYAPDPGSLPLPCGAELREAYAAAKPAQTLLTTDFLRSLAAHAAVGASGGGVVGSDFHVVIHRVDAVQGNPLAQGRRETAQDLMDHGWAERLSDEGGTDIVFGSDFEVVVRAVTRAGR